MYRSYVDRLCSEYSKQNKPRPHLSMKEHLAVCEKVMADLQLGEEQEKANKVATATSEKVANYATAADVYDSFSGEYLIPTAIL